MQEAAELTRRFDGQLELVHVHPPSAPAVAIGPVPVPYDVVQTAVQELREMMGPWEEEAARIAKRAVRTTLNPGSPADEIVRYAREQAMDVVVVGTHGRQGLGRLLIGSVAERVVREAPCPVIVIRGREKTRS
jgi:nucleotide-binding universal stress UspA family protein